MSKVKITGNPSGSAVYTLTTGTGSTDRTITLPDASGTLAFTTDDDDKLLLSGGTITGNLQVNGTFKSRSIDDTDNASGTAITIYDSEEVKLHNMVEIHTAKTAVPTYSAIRLQSPVDAIGQLVGQTYVLNGVAGRPRAAIFAKAELANGYAASLTFMTRSAADGSTLHATDDIRMTIKSNGNVGIGDSSPSHTLVVDSSGGANFMVARSAAGTGGLYIESNGTQGVIRNPANQNINFQTNGNNTRMSVTSAGLCFGTDTAAANALDDYEEGTFTPVVTASSGSATYSTQTGTYTKIGNVVTINVAVQANKNNLNGPLKVSLPIACGAENRGQEYDWYVPSGTAILTTNIRISASASVMQLMGNTAASVDGTGRQYQASDVAGEMYFWMSITYKV